LNEFQDHLFNDSPGAGAFLRLMRFERLARLKLRVVGRGNRAIHALGRREVDVAFSVVYQT
jgi:hypothetical protein